MISATIFHDGKPAGFLKIGQGRKDTDLRVVCADFFAENNIDTPCGRMNSADFAWPSAPSGRHGDPGSRPQPRLRHPGPRSGDWPKQECGVSVAVEDQKPENVIEALLKKAKGLKTPPCKLCDDTGMVKLTDGRSARCPMCSRFYR